MHHRVGWLDGVAVFLTRIGTDGAVWIALALVLALGLRRRELLVAIPLVLVADGLAYLLKVIVKRPRPHDHPLVHVSTWSFPSGHTATAFAGATFLALLLPRLAPGVLLLAVAIAFSRLYVGVHYPLDVLAGAALGTLVGWAGARALPRLGRFRPRSRRAPRPG